MTSLLKGREKRMNHKNKPTLNTITVDEQGAAILELRLTYNTILPSIDFLPMPSTDRSTLPLPPNLSRYNSPLSWPEPKKQWMVVLSCLVTILAAYAAGGYSPPEAELTQKWNISSVVYNLGITAFTFGFAVAPMFLAPLSEMHGRRPVFLASGLLFTGNICSG
jgi:hypothetical protein